MSYFVFWGSFLFILFFYVGLLSVMYYLLAGKFPWG